MANGKVCTGFSKPYVAKYNANAGAVTYTGGMVLARGVDVNITPDTSDDNNFYADNQLAESANGIFTGGTLSLTVDGLKTAAEKFIMGLPAAGADGFTAYGDDQQTPDVGVGYIARYMEDGVTTYTPTIIAKARFNQIESNAATQEEEIDWQTQALTAVIMRGDDANHNWKYIGKDYSSEADAEKALKIKMNIPLTGPTVEAESSAATLFGTPVSDMQEDVVVANNAITGTLKYLSDSSSALVSKWGAGNFLALKFSNADSRATSIKVGLNPSEGSGLVELDEDMNGVFKITDKTAQVFKVVTTDGNTTTTDTYALTGLTMEGAGA